MFKPAAIIVTHSTPVFGPPNALADYLLARGVDLIYIDHPLDFDPQRHSRLTIWQESRIVIEQEYPNWLSWRPINYLKDFLLTIWILLRWTQGRRYQWFFGLDSLACLAALWLKAVIDYDQLVAYNADYSTDRFHSVGLNIIYRLIDRFTMKRANWLWCVTERIAVIRRQSRSADRVMVVPNGVNLNSVKFKGAHNKGLLFIGNLTAEKGVEAILRALTKIKAVELTIFGQGTDQPRLERLVKKLALSHRVHWQGQISHSALLATLADYQVGIALYQSNESYVYYSDPLKVKEYLAAGLPVLISDLPEVATIINQRQAGVVIHSGTNLIQAIKHLMNHQPAMAAAARQLATEYDWATIFDRAFRQCGFAIPSPIPRPVRSKNAPSA